MATTVKLRCVTGIFKLLVTILFYYIFLSGELLICLDVRKIVLAKRLYFSLVSCRTQLHM